MADDKNPQSAPTTQVKTVEDLHKAGDEVTEAGFIGDKADPRPNEDYTVSGVIRRKREGDHQS